MTVERVLDAIYEAGAFPDRWPLVLERMAQFVGARGGNFIYSGASGIRLNPSPSVAETTRRFTDEGWNEQNSRVGRLVDGATHPGFLTDRDLHSVEELATLPIYRDFLTPLGFGAGAATLIQGGANDAMIVTLEGFACHDAASAVVGGLDRLRPHIARSVMIGGQIQAARSDNILRAFERVGLCIALLGRRGRVMDATSGFARYFGDLLSEGPGRLRIVDSTGDARLARELAMDIEGAGASIAIRDHDQIGRAILHLVPAKLDARDLFSQIHCFAIMTDPTNKAIPGADLIAALFDLTPAEARVARGIASGRSITVLAREWKVSEETIKSQLKKVFAKTSTRRQGELAALISNFGELDPHR